MSELDLDIRAVASASFGARSAAADASQIQAAAETSSSPAVSAIGDSSAQQVAAGQPTFRYDSFRFIYQSDYGKIVLIDQNPETGKAVSQIPSQRALQLYAEQRRAEVQTSVGGGKTGGQGSTGGTTGGRTLITPSPSATGAGTGTGQVSSAPTVTTTTTAPAPTLIPVSVPAAAVISAAFSPVNIDRKSVV